MPAKKINTHNAVLVTLFIVRGILTVASYHFIYGCSIGNSKLTLVVPGFEMVKCQLLYNLAGGFTSKPYNDIVVLLLTLTLLLSLTMETKNGIC